MANQRGQAESTVSRRERGFSDRPPQAARLERDRYHREVDELDYIVPKTFHEHDDRDVWKPRRGKDLAVQHASRNAGFSGRDQRDSGERQSRDGPYGREQRYGREPRYGRRQDYDRSTRPRSRERTMHADRPEFNRPQQNGDRRLSARELARMDFERSRSRAASNPHDDPRASESIEGQNGDNSSRQQQAQGRPQNQARSWTRGPADVAAKWGHDGFDEIKDLPPEKKDPLDYLRRLY